MSREIYDAKYVLQTVLKRFPVKDLRVENQAKYRIDLKVMDDIHDVIYFLVDKEDVTLNKDDTCDIILVQDEYAVHYFYADENEDMIRKMIHRCVITDAYYNAYPERKVFCFDLMCVPAGSVRELDATFALRLMSSNIVKGSFMTFAVPKKSLYWVRNEYAEKDYAHVDLSRNMYEIGYRNRDSHWKDAKLEVSKDRIIKDFLHAKRASYMSMSVREYEERLQGSYEDSNLFANLE